MSVKEYLKLVLSSVIYGVIYQYLLAMGGTCQNKGAMNLFTKFFAGICIENGSDIVNVVLYILPLFLLYSTKNNLWTKETSQNVSFVMLRMKTKRRFYLHSVFQNLIIVTIYTIVEISVFIFWHFDCVGIDVLQRKNCLIIFIYISKYFLALQIFQFIVLYLSPIIALSVSVFLHAGSIITASSFYFEDNIKMLHSFLLYNPFCREIPNYYRVYSVNTLQTLLIIFGCIITLFLMGGYFIKFKSFYK